MIKGDCNTCIHKNLSVYSNTCMRCGISRKNYIPKTNRDRLRAMTDEELAEWLWFKVGKCPPFDVCPSQCTPCEAKDCWIDWLKQKVKE